MRGATPEKGKKHDYAYVIRIDRCNGSGKCVQACSSENAVPEGLFRTWIERYVKTGEGVYVDSPNGGMDGFAEVEPRFKNDVLSSWFAPKLCNHCRNPPCVQVCPVGATFATDEGFVLVDNAHCIGCAACVHGCPYGSRFMNHETNVADKCTWCYHRVKRGQQPVHGRWRQGHGLRDFRQCQPVIGRGERVQHADRAHDRLDLARAFVVT